MYRMCYIALTKRLPQRKELKGEKFHPRQKIPFTRVLDILPSVRYAIANFDAIIRVLCCITQSFTVQYNARMYAQSSGLNWAPGAFKSDHCFASSNPCVHVTISPKERLREAPIVESMLLVYMYVIKRFSYAIKGAYTYKKKIGIASQKRDEMKENRETYACLRRRCASIIDR